MLTSLRIAEPAPIEALAVLCGYLTDENGIEALHVDGFLEDLAQPRQRL